jgi:ubiquinone/menaquinone biosynthesis C-methylase UbiE
VDTTATARPVRTEVAASYDRGVEGYVNVWSAVILPPARAVVAALNLSRTATVVDVGAGSGALVPSIRQAAPDGVVIAVDASFEMLRAARDRTDAQAAQVDALALPLREASADAVLLAFVLFHLSDPGQALSETARVLRAGGTVGTVTWANESTLPAYTVWDQTLTDAGALPLSARRVDTGLDSPQAMTDILSAAGFHPTRVWTEALSHQWTPETYWQLATGSGLNRLRLETLDNETRADTLTVARQRLAALIPPDFAWTGSVVCAVASKARPRREHA